MVTGAGRGIGRSSALELARRGARVAATARTESQLESLVQEVAAAGGRAVAIADDLSDPAAPARNIRIELPSIKPKDLRRYKKGVGMEMAPELRDVMNRVRKSMLEGDDLLPDSISWDLGMICSFSLQIIFLVAFIVMFIFLIALNFIFWWLPFLKICFPIPVKKSSS